MMHTPSRNWQQLASSEQCIAYCNAQQPAVQQQQHAAYMHSYSYTPTEQAWALSPTNATNTAPYASTAFTALLLVLMSTATRPLVFRTAVDTRCCSAVSGQGIHGNYAEGVEPLCYLNKQVKVCNCAPESTVPCITTS